VSYVGWDRDGKAFTFDLWCMWAGWDGGTIHEAFRYFADMPTKRQDSFCGFLVDAIDNDQVKDLGNGFAAKFTRIRLGGRV
jgi:hypothetical protein